MNSVCERCPIWASCALNPQGKACLKVAKEHGFDARPTKFDRIKAMDREEMAVFFAKINAQLHRADLSIIGYHGSDVNTALDWLDELAE